MVSTAGEPDTAAGALVEVRLRGDLARYLAGQDRVLVPGGRTVLEVVAELGIPPGRAVVAVRNGHTCDVREMLAPGDRLTLVPPIAGGNTHVRSEP